MKGQKNELKEKKAWGADGNKGLEADRGKGLGADGNKGLGIGNKDSEPPLSWDGSPIVL